MEPAHMFGSQMLAYLMAVPGVFLVSWVRGVSLALTEAALLGRRLKSVSLHPMDYIDAMGGFVYVVRLVGWHRMDTFANPALMDVKKQLALHLGAAVVSVGFCGLLQGLTMVVAMAVSMDQPLPVSLFSSLSGVIYMAQLMLLGSIVAHLLPLYPAPGYRIVLRFLSPGIRVKLTHYESLMALVLVLLALFASGILHQYSNLLLTKMNGLTGLILSIAYLPVYGLWLFSMRR